MPEYAKEHPVLIDEKGNTFNDALNSLKSDSVSYDSLVNFENHGYFYISIVSKGHYLYKHRCS